MNIMIIYDAGHELSKLKNLNLRARRLVDKIAKLTTVIELKGMSIAATIGDKIPWTAKYMPTIL